MLKSDRDNLNIKAAYLHVLTDLFGSIIAILSGLSTYFLGWLWVDPLAKYDIKHASIKKRNWSISLGIKNT